MTYTNHNLAYLKHPRDDDGIGQNWDIAEIDFGTERFTITTDHVHASELVLGDPEADVKLWCKAPVLMMVLKRVHRRLMDTYTPEDATPLHEELLPLLRNALGEAT